MQRTQVVSSNVRSIGYAGGVIEIEFKDGCIYQYFGVNQGVFSSLLC